MVKLHEGGVYLVNGETLVPESEAAKVEQMTGKAEEIHLYVQPMTENERKIVKAGSLINFNRNGQQ